MTPDPAALARRLRRLYPRQTVERVLAHTAETQEAAEDLSRYRNDPVGFAADVLGVSLTPDQQEIIQALPGRVKIESGHNVGKSFLMAVIALWWFYTRPSSVVVCNAPKLEHLRDVLWSEIRMLWMRARVTLPDYFVGPKAPEMYEHPDHWAKGYTTSKGESYQGRHRESMLFLFDEDEGIEPVYWTATSTMYQPGQDHAWVASCNPLTTSSQSYLESLIAGPDGTPKWRLFRLSSLNHPNIVAELSGQPPPVPNAVSVAQVDQWVKDWCTPVDRPEDRTSTDIEWHPGSGRWYRPGPVFKARAAGIRPTEGVDTIWSQAVFELCCRPRWDPADCWHRKFGITVGVDPAGYGDDDTVFHVRCGPLSLHHESRNGWGPGQSAGRIKELCREWCAWYNALATFDRPPIRPENVDVIIEFDGGLGVGVHSHADDFVGWHGVTVGSKSDMCDPNGRPMYANLRAELWCEAAKAAAAGWVDLSRLPPDVRDRLRIQLLTPFYVVKPDGSRLVEPKEEVKERLGRSPDDADGLILSHCRAGVWAPRVLYREDSE